MGIAQSIAAGVALAMLVMTPAILIVLSRRKKAIAGESNLVGALGSVLTTLRPEGAVLIRGELWRARSLSGSKIERGREVRVVGASGHLLEVEFRG
jgi:membrane-bound serine protease (ClpP class)